MNIRPALLFAVALSVTFSPVASASSSRAGEFRSFTLNLKPGSSPATVRSVLGAPDAVLGSDLWIYRNFGEPNPNSDNPEFDTLVVAFANDRVIAVKITDGRVVRQLLAQAARATNAIAAATTPTKHGAKP